MRLKQIVKYTYSISNNFSDEKSVFYMSLYCNRLLLIYEYRESSSAYRANSAERYARVIRQYSRWNLRFNICISGFGASKHSRKDRLAKRDSNLKTSIASFMRNVYLSANLYKTHRLLVGYEDCLFNVQRHLINGRFYKYVIHAMCTGSLQIRVFDSQCK